MWSVCTPVVRYTWVVGLDVFAYYYHCFFFQFVSRRVAAAFMFLCDRVAECLVLLQLSCHCDRVAVCLVLLQVSCFCVIVLLYALCCCRYHVFA